MRKIFEGIGIAVAVVMVIVAFIGLIWFAQGNDLALRKAFAPKYEDVRRETFEHSKAFNQGMIQELQDMQFRYVQADDAHKDALASIILHRVADYDDAKLPADLRTFVQTLRRERTMSK